MVVQEACLPCRRAKTPVAAAPGLERSSSPSSSGSVRRPEACRFGRVGAGGEAIAAGGAAVALSGAALAVGGACHGEGGAGASPCGRACHGASAVTAVGPAWAATAAPRAPDSMRASACVSLANPVGAPRCVSRTKFALRCLWALFLCVSMSASARLRVSVSVCQCLSVCVSVRKLERLRRVTRRCPPSRAAEQGSSFPNHGDALGAALRLRIRRPGYSMRGATEDPRRRSQRGAHVVSKTFTAGVHLGGFAGAKAWWRQGGRRRPPRCVVPSRHRRRRIWDMAAAMPAAARSE